MSFICPVDGCDHYVTDETVDDHIRKAHTVELDHFGVDL